MAAETLVLEDVRVRRGALPILHGINLEVGDTTLAVLGRNGAGKTTLCHAIMGLLPPVSGSIRFYGKEIAGLPPDEIARLGVTIVPQGRRVFASLTVDEHLRLVGGRRPGAWRIERVYGLFPRLDERRRSYGNQLSGGEQQMLSTARALLTNPKLMLLDEPSEGLAPKILDHLLELLATLRAEGTAVLLVEQKLSVGTSAASRVALMSAGEIAIVTDAETLLRDEQLQHRYLGITGASTAGSALPAGRVHGTVAP